MRVFCPTLFSFKTQRTGYRCCSFIGVVTAVQSITKFHRVGRLTIGGRGCKIFDTTFFSLRTFFSVCGKASGGHPWVRMIESLRCIFRRDNGSGIPQVTPGFVYFAAHIKMCTKVMPCDKAEEILALTFDIPNNKSK